MTLEELISLLATAQEEIFLQQLPLFLLENDEHLPEFIMWMKEPQRIIPEALLARIHQIFLEKFEIDLAGDASLPASTPMEVGFSEFACKESEDCVMQDASDYHQAPHVLTVGYAQEYEADPETFFNKYLQVQCEQKSNGSDHYSIIQGHYIRDEAFEVHCKFAIIWDEDHDVRIMDAVAQLLIQRRLHHVVMMRERKGQLSLVLNRPVKKYRQQQSMSIHKGRDEWSIVTYSIKELGSFRFGLPYDILKKLIQDHGLGFEMKSRAGDDGIYERLQKTEARHLALMQFAHLHPATIGRPPTFYVIPDAQLRTDKEIYWQELVSARFFRVARPLRPKSIAEGYYGELLRWLKNPEKTPPLSLDDRCRRSLMIALVKVMQVFHGMPFLKFTIGGTTIFLQSTEERKQRQWGSCKMIVEGLKFDIAYGFLCARNIADMIRAQWTCEAEMLRRREMLTTLIKRKAKTMIPFTLHDLNVHQLIKLPEERSFEECGKKKYAEKACRHINFLNGLVFLIMTVEPLVRLYRTPKGQLHSYYQMVTSGPAFDQGDSEDRVDDAFDHIVSADAGAVLAARSSDTIPVAIAQSRALQLFFAGKISLEDMVGGRPLTYKGDEDHVRAQFGIVTGKFLVDNLENVLDKLVQLNKKYNKEILHPAIKSAQAPGSGKIKTQFCIAGRNTMLSELAKIYGVGDEEDSDYSDDDMPHPPYFPA